MAVFGLVCAPTLSHALAHARQDGAWASLCTSNGLQPVLADGSAAAPGQAVTPGSAGLHTLSHCPLCGVTSGGMAPAPSPSGGVAHPPGIAHVQHGQASVRAPAPPRHDSPARAPPSLL